MIPLVLHSTSGVAPVFLERCPVHGQLVAFDGDHRLLGVCSGCAVEAAQATLAITHGQAL